MSLAYPGSRRREVCLQLRPGRPTPKTPLCSPTTAGFQLASGSCGAHQNLLNWSELSQTVPRNDPVQELASRPRFGNCHLIPQIRILSEQLLFESRLSGTSTPDWDTPTAGFRCLRKVAPRERRRHVRTRGASKTLPYKHISSSSWVGAGAPQKPPNWRIPPASFPSFPKRNVIPNADLIPVVTAAVKHQ